LPPQSKRAKNLYLRNIDNLCVKGEYNPIYKLFYDLVECFFVLFCCTLMNLSLTRILPTVAPRPRKQPHYYRKFIQLGQEGLLDWIPQTLKIIMSAEAYKSGQVLQATQDRNREFISLWHASLRSGLRSGEGSPRFFYIRANHTIYKTLRWRS
jgi:hypothetical protein